MYKFVKLLLIAYFLLIGFVLVGGFIAKQHTKKPTTNSSSSSSTPESFTAENAAAHNSEDDCWLLISGKVYDVTDFISKHPGGKERIIPNCGQDATQAFESQDGKGGHSQTAQDTLKQYYIGDLKQ